MDKTNVKKSRKNGQKMTKVLSRVLKKSEFASLWFMNGSQDETMETVNGKTLVDIAQILPNRQVCFGNRKLMRSVPENPVYAAHFIDIINTFIKFLNHRYQSGPVLFRYV